MPSIYLIRHEEPEMRGTSSAARIRPYRGGEAVGHRKTRGPGFAAIYVSPLRRARQTAEAIGERGVPVVIPELAEIDFGEWEGLNLVQIQERWPDAACRKTEDWLGVTTPGGESWVDFCVRVDRALDIVLAGPKPAAIVAHMVVNSALAARLTGSDPKRFRQEYGEINACEAPCQHSQI